MKDGRKCPWCGAEFCWVDGKDKRKYARHLEDHLEEIERRGPEVFAA